MTDRPVLLLHGAHRAVAELLVAGIELRLERAGCAPVVARRCTLGHPDRFCVYVGNRELGGEIEFPGFSSPTVAAQAFVQACRMSGGRA